MRIEELEDLHKGKICFIVGAGPSLHFQNIELLKNGITISVNSSVSKIYFCDYFISDDWSVSEWDYFYNLPKNSIKLFYKNKLKGFTNHIKDDEIIWFDHKLWYDSNRKVYNKDGLDLTKDPLKPIIGARTSAGSALHFAYIMGCDPIVLVGIDCCLRDGKRYFWEYDGEKKCRRIRGRLAKNIVVEKKDGKELDHHSVDFVKYWNALSKKTKEIGLNVVDCSAGILDCFPKMTIEEVIYAKQSENIGDNNCKSG